MRLFRLLDNFYIKAGGVATLIFTVFSANSSNNHLDGIDNTDIAQEEKTVQIKGHLFDFGYAEEESSEFHELPERTRYSSREALSEDVRRRDNFTQS